MRELRLVALGCVLVGVSVVSGCGDDDDDIGTTGGTGGGGTGGGGTGGTGGGDVDATEAGGTGGGEAGAEMGPVSTDPNVICADMQRYCERFNECAPYYIGLEFGTVAKCTERLKLSCVDAVMAAGSGRDGATMAACTAALATASCDDLFNRNIAACNFKGTRANGAACGANEQCSSGRCATTATGCGMCADFAADGAVCAADDDCAPGRLCNESDRCVVPADAQAVCSTARPCRYGFSCVAGTCQPAAMTEAGVCAGGGCSLPHGLYCATTNTCARIPLAPPGMACRDSASAPTYCAGGSCILPQTGDVGTCFAFAADGQPCGDSSDNELDCQAPALCLAGTCKLPSSSTCN